MQIIDWSQRDYLSVLSDALSVLGLLGVAGFIVFKFSKKKNTQKNENIENVKKIKIKETGRKIFGLPIGGTYAKEMTHISSDSTKTKKEMTTNTGLNLKDEKGGDK